MNVVTIFWIPSYIPSNFRIDAYFSMREVRLKICDKLNGSRVELARGESGRLSCDRGVEARGLLKLLLLLLAW